MYEPVFHEEKGEGVQKSQTFDDMLDGCPLNDVKASARRLHYAAVAAIFAAAQRWNCDKGAEVSEIPEWGEEWFLKGKS